MQPYTELDHWLISSRIIYSESSLSPGYRTRYFSTLFLRIFSWKCPKVEPGAFCMQSMYSSTIVGYSPSSWVWTFKTSTVVKGKGASAIIIGCAKESDENNHGNQIFSLANVSSAEDRWLKLWIRGLEDPSYVHVRSWIRSFPSLTMISS